MAPIHRQLSKRQLAEAAPATPKFVSRPERALTQTKSHVETRARAATVDGL
jgi:hypothetical protein